MRARVKKQEEECDLYGTCAEQPWESLKISIGKAKATLKVKECGGEGHCMFYSIARALNSLPSQKAILLKQSDIRTMLVQSLLNPEHPMWLDHFLDRYHQLDFNGYVLGQAFETPLSYYTNQDIFAIQNHLLALDENIRRPYEGDDTALKWLMNHPFFITHKIRVIVVKQDLDREFHVVPIWNLTTDATDAAIDFPTAAPFVYFILFNSPGHWQLLGSTLKNKKDVTIFHTFQQLPEVIKKNAFSETTDRERTPCATKDRDSPFLKWSKTWDLFVPFVQSQPLLLRDANLVRNLQSYCWSTPPINNFLNVLTYALIYEFGKSSFESIKTTIQDRFARLISQDKTSAQTWLAASRYPFVSHAIAITHEREWLAELQKDLSDEKNLTIDWNGIATRDALMYAVTEKLLSPWKDPLGFILYITGDNQTWTRFVSAPLLHKNATETERAKWILNTKWMVAIQFITLSKTIGWILLGDTASSKSETYRLFTFGRLPKLFQQPDPVMYPADFYDVLRLGPLASFADIYKSGWKLEFALRFKVDAKTEREDLDEFLEWDLSPFLLDVMKQLDIADYPLNTKHRTFGVLNKRLHIKNRLLLSLGSIKDIPVSLLERSFAFEGKKLESWMSDSKQTNFQTSLKDLSALVFQYRVPPTTPYVDEVLVGEEGKRERIRFKNPDVLISKAHKLMLLSWTTETV